MYSKLEVIKPPKTYRESTRQPLSRALYHKSSASAVPEVLMPLSAQAYDAGDRKVLALDDHEATLLSCWLRNGQWLRPELAQHLCIRRLQVRGVVPVHYVYLSQPVNQPASCHYVH